MNRLQVFSGLMVGDGNTASDWEVVDIDDDSGIITLRFRAESSGSGDGRIYTLDAQWCYRKRAEKFSGTGGSAGLVRSRQGRFHRSSERF